MIAILRAMKTYGMKGVGIGASVVPGFELSDPRLDPFWAACADLGIPVHRHSIAVGPPETEETGPAVIAVGARETHLFFQRGLGHLMFAGVFERFPDLQFVSVESGIGWIPFMLESLDYQYVEITSRKVLQRMPSEYFATNFYACFWFENFGRFVAGKPLRNRVDTKLGY